MGGQQQVLRRRTGRKLLLPGRDMPLAQQRQLRHQHGSLPGKILHRFQLKPARAGLVCQIQPHQQRGECVAVFDHHEAPGRQLAMIRHASGNRQDLAEFARIRSGGHKIPSLPRAAGLEEREQARAIIEVDRFHARVLGTGAPGRLGAQP